VRIGSVLALGTRQMSIPTPGGFLKLAWCLIAGHDDHVLRAPDRLRLRCSHCGRTTAGWELSNGPTLQDERIDRLRKRSALEPVMRRALGRSQLTRS
jgi:hypothetical protein